MKVVHISTYAAGGGAAIATYRIHKMLLEKGIDSELVVLRDPPPHLSKVTSVAPRQLNKLKDHVIYNINRFLLRFYPNRRPVPFSFNFFKQVQIDRLPFIKEADIVCLYWIGEGFLTPEQIAKIDKPIIWRLSDKWAFTGGCHLSGGCTRYEQQCGLCPQLGSKKLRDITHYFWSRKNKAWHNKDLITVAPSSWIEECAKRSSLLRNKTIIRIPTGVDHTLFKPFSKKSSREILNISTSAKVILFGAINALTTLHKGSDFFKKLLNAHHNDDIIFMVFGSGSLSLMDKKDNVRVLGVLQDEVSLALAYNAADVFMSLSPEENLPNTVLEAMACGTPSIAFENSGGVVDVIQHKLNGYLAKSYDLEDVVEGISWIIHSNQDGKISINARQKILKTFTLEKQVNSYISLYKRIMERKSH